jgi:hypothetical protein
MSCNVSENCLNTHRCFNCSFDGDRFSDYGNNLYLPIDRSIEHPIILERKLTRKADKKKEKQLEKQQKDKERSALVKKAAKVEEKVKASLNSGRVNRDGDLQSEDLVIDVKYQSTRKDPVIKSDEFKKVNTDCLRAGKRYGILCIENKDGERFYVIGEELFKEKFL